MSEKPAGQQNWAYWSELALNIARRHHRRKRGMLEPEDYAQEALRRLFDSLQNKAVNSDTPLLKSGWIATTIRNLIIDDLRRSEYRESVGITSEIPRDDRPPWDDISDNTEQLILSIPHSYGRTCRVLYFGHRSAIPEHIILDILGYSPETIRKHKQRARSFLDKAHCSKPDEAYRLPIEMETVGLLTTARSYFAKFLAENNAPVPRAVHDNNRVLSCAQIASHMTRIAPSAVQVLCLFILAGCGNLIHVSRRLDSDNDTLIRMRSDIGRAYRALIQLADKVPDTFDGEMEIVRTVIENTRAIVSYCNMVRLAHRIRINCEEH